MNFGAMVWLALEGLLRKKGRNTLTMSGVFIGVFALTLIVSLGQGLSRAVSETVSGTDNLRQVGLTGGFGIELSNDPAEIEISGEMTDARRDRLRRAAVNRRQIRQVAGRRANAIDDKTIAQLSKLPHIESIQPVIVERYEMKLNGHQSPATLSYGVDVGRKRYADRVIAGSYFSSAAAPEAIVHEYLLYKWGMLHDGDYASVIGQKVRLKTIQTELTPEQQAPPMLQEMLRDLNEEERKAMQTLLPRLLKQFGQSNERRAAEREFTVVGVLREQMPGDPFNVIEDGNAVQADLFLPQETARELFLASAVNVELGYPRALVTVTDSEFAPEVEQTLRDKGYTAFSVASALKQIESVLLMITVSISFLTGIALIVSTLGIVNTMITSVIERTREIGIFKAVGATNAQVMTVFLCESALIGLIGGLLGLGLAALAMVPGDMLAIQLINEKAAIPFDQPVFVLPLWLMIAGPALGTGTAILAAILPARRAARIDPVKALRHD